MKSDLEVGQTLYSLLDSTPVRVTHIVEGKIVIFKQRKALLAAGRKMFLENFSHSRKKVWAYQLRLLKKDLQSSHRSLKQFRKSQKYYEKQYQREVKDTENKINKLSLKIQKFTKK